VYGRRFSTAKFNLNVTIRVSCQVMKYFPVLFAPFEQQYVNFILRSVTNTLGIDVFCILFAYT